MCSRSNPGVFLSWLYPCQGKTCRVYAPVGGTRGLPGPGEQGVCKRGGKRDPLVLEQRPQYYLLLPVIWRQAANPSDEPLPLSPPHDRDVGKSPVLCRERLLSSGWGVSFTWAAHHHIPGGLCFGRSLVHTLLVEDISKDSDAYPAYAGNDGIDIQEEGESHTTHQAE